MNPASSIVLGYIGVHQMFQLALAAHESGRLERLHCSLVDAPGKWGRLIGARLKASSLKPMGIEGLPPGLISELPMPLLSRHIAKIWRHLGPDDYHHSNQWFDRTLARRLSFSSASLFVGTETCALESLRAARRAGMVRLLDCPGIPAELLGFELAHACDSLDLPPCASRVSERTVERRRLEMAEADVVNLCSDVQFQYYQSAGFPVEKMRVNSLWVDPIFAKVPMREGCEADSGPLRVLFVGNATIAKGAPFALKAAQLLGADVRLTLCGGIDEQVRNWAGTRLGEHQLLGWCSREALAGVYQRHDVLLFPTLGDSFGFVAVEAMACGLPVITTSNAGVPVPDESWKVPPRDSNALAAAIARYANDRSLLRRDSARARAFAQQFTPENYRGRIRVLFDELLSRK